MNAPWGSGRSGRAPLRAVRTRGQAASIGLMHGLAGTGAVVVLLIAALPTRLEAALALAVFAWVLTRPIIEPVYRGVLIPGLGLFGVVFGLWYAGIG